MVPLSESPVAETKRLDENEVSGCRAMVRNTLHLDLHILELQDRQQRLTLRGLLNEEHRMSMHGLDGEELEASSVREALLSFDDEQEIEELDLAELSTISGGVGLPEALVSSTILMVLVSQSSGLFADSMGGLSKSRVRDGLNASIAADIELVRNQVSGFRSSQASGQLSFNPTDSDASDGLGSNFLTEMDGSLGSLGTDDVDGDGINETVLSQNLDGADFAEHLDGVTITRSISADPDHPHLIRVSYTTEGHDSVQTSNSTDMVFPAQGWLP